MALKIQWIDGGREARNKPDPHYPQGIDLDCSDGAKIVCETKLPYPAKRCGQFLVTCAVCGFSVVVTTAGRADDPRSLKAPCQIKGRA